MERAANPERLYRETYLQLIRNSVGTNMFRNFYVSTQDGVEFDATDNGASSCAFFVSAVLTLFKKVSGVHGTIASTQRDMEKSGWTLVNNMEEGDVLIWESILFGDTEYSHIGFYVGGDRAISNSSVEGKVKEHDIRFGQDSRDVTHIYRMETW